MGVVVHYIYFPLPFLQRSPIYFTLFSQIHDPFLFTCYFHTCMYMHTPKYINTACPVYTMLLECVFSGLTISCCPTVLQLGCCEPTATLMWLSGRLSDHVVTSVLVLLLPRYLSYPGLGWNGHPHFNSTSTPARLGCSHFPTPKLLAYLMLDIEVL